MVQASVVGAVDFAQAELRSTTWWRTLWLKLDALTRRHLCEYHRVNAQNALQLSCVPDISDEKVQALHKQALESLGLWKSHLFPWIEVPKEEDIGQSLRQLWVEKFGDPNDPVVKERIRYTYEQMTGKKLNE